MEAVTDIGADAPASYALERSAPADTPAYLSAHDAAAVLRKLRQPKANDTNTPDPSARATAAAPEPGKESTAADATDDAAPGPRGLNPGMRRIPASGLRVPIGKPSFPPSSHRGLGRRKTRSSSPASLARRKSELPGGRIRRHQIDGGC